MDQHLGQGYAARAILVSGWKPHVDEPTVRVGQWLEDQPKLRGLRDIALRGSRVDLHICPLDLRSFVSRLVIICLQDQAVITLALRDVCLHAPKGRYVITYDGDGELDLGMDATPAAFQKGSVRHACCPELLYEGA